MIVVRQSERWREGGGGGGDESRRGRTGVLGGVMGGS